MREVGETLVTGGGVVNRRGSKILLAGDGRAGSGLWRGIRSGGMSANGLVSGVVQLRGMDL